MQVETTKEFNIVRDRIENDPSPITHGVARRGGSRHPLTEWKGMPGCPLGRAAWWFLLKLKVHIPFDMAVLALGIYPTDTLIHNEPGGTGICRSIFTGSMDLKEPKCPSVCCYLNKLWCSI